MIYLDIIKQSIGRVILSV